MSVLGLPRGPLLKAGLWRGLDMYQSVVVRITYFPKCSL